MRHVFRVMCTRWVFSVINRATTHRPGSITYRQFIVLTLSAGWADDTKCAREVAIIRRAFAAFIKRARRHYCINRFVNCSTHRWLISCYGCLLVTMGSVPNRNQVTSATFSFIFPTACECHFSSLVMREWKPTDDGHYNINPLIVTRSEATA